MTRLEALKELAAKVEAGVDQWSANQVNVAMGGVHVRKFYEAFHGSLDAAKSLHEAVIPNEGWHVEWVAKYPSLAFKPAAMRASVGWASQHVAYATTPARAWLLAILRALIAQGDGK